MPMMDRCSECAADLDDGEGSVGLCGSCIMREEAETAEVCGHTLTDNDGSEGLCSACADASEQDERELILRVEMGNAAMDEGEDLAFAVEQAAKLMREDYTSGQITDGNGNRCGRWEIGEPNPELSKRAREVVALMLADEEKLTVLAIDREEVETTEEVWSEIRRAFPLTAGISPKDSAT